MESASMFHFALSKWGTFISLYDKLKCFETHFKRIKKNEISEMSEQPALIWHFVSGLFDLRGEGGGKEEEKL